MTRDLIAGIDSSTQSCTVVLRRIGDGRVVGQARHLHPPTTPPVSEQDPQAWWTAFEACARDLSGDLDRVAAISVGGQGHGLVMLGVDGAALRPAKLWNDTESAPDALGLLARLPAADWAARTGSVPSPALTVAKLAWTERVHPGLVARAARIMLPFDYMVWRLSGEAVTERGGSSGTGYFNPFTNDWDFGLADLAAPGTNWARVLPRIIGSGQRAGMGQGPLAGAVVGAGSGDNMMAALGLAIRAGDTAMSLGTSGTVYGLAETGVIDPTGAINGYADASGAYLPMITTLNAAKVTDWVRRLLGVTPEEFDALALADRPRGLVLLPYLDGERTPNLPRARGMLSGISTLTSREDLARAAVEGVLCGLLDGLDLLKAHGLRDDGRLIVTGGAAKSRAYRQVLADLTGREVWHSAETETAAMGAAVQALAALTGATPAEAASQWAPELECVARPGAGTACAAEIRAAYTARAAAYPGGKE